MLGRCRRSVLVCDTGNPRNAASHALHGYLTRDGIAPQEFRAIGRRELERYDTVELRDVGVTAAACQSDARFDVTLADDQIVRSRKLLIATGVVRQPPGDRRHPRAVRPQRLSLPLLRRLGSARSADRHLRPRRPRARAVARADRRGAATSCSARTGRPRSTTRAARVSSATASRCARSASPRSKDATGSSSASCSQTATPLRAAGAVLHDRPVPAIRARDRPRLRDQRQGHRAHRQVRSDAPPGPVRRRRRLARGAVGHRRRRGRRRGGVRHQHRSHEGRPVW